MLDLALSIPFAWWVALITYLLIRVKFLNRGMARLLGAPAGRSLSAHLWALEDGGQRAARPVRLFVDAIFWVLLGQVWHCKTHFEREAA